MTGNENYLPKINM